MPSSISKHHAKCLAPLLPLSHTKIIVASASKGGRLHKLSFWTFFPRARIIGSEKTPTLTSQRETFAEYFGAYWADEYSKEYPVVLILASGLWHR